MNGKRAHPNDIRNLQGALKSIQKKAGAHTPPLPFTMCGKPCQNEERYRMARHAFRNAFGRVSVAHFSGNNRVKPYDGFPAQTDVGL